ncbi:hypothetical protein C8R46DRAFT_1218173 [Mycena filopes]|nr:hypothetical protein C8R46DRAFT_1218173 [Mycena filopes]
MLWGAFFPNGDTLVPFALDPPVEAAVHDLTGCPYDPRWGEVLEKLNPGVLFHLALRSQALFDVVMTHVRVRQPPTGLRDEVRGGGSSDRLSRLPVDVLAYMVSYLPLGPRRNLARTSRKFFALAARELQASVSALHRHFGLCYAEVWFMQAATSSILAGQVKPRLFDLSCDVDGLDFYAPDYAFDWVVRFFCFATRPAPREGELKAGWGVNSTATFIRRRGSAFDTVRVLQSCSDSALDVIPYMPFSHMFGAVTAYGVWLAYPESAARGHSFANKDTVSASDRYITRLLTSYSKQFRFVFELDGICGAEPECPATPRSTVDAGCVNIFFPALPMGIAVTPATAYPVDSVMLWSLQGVSCQQGANFRRRGDAHKTWSDVLRFMIRRAVRAASV